MRVLLDTNILLDVLLEREPWVTDSSAVWQAHDEGQVQGHVIACALADIFYIARRATTLQLAHAAVSVCLEAFHIGTVDHQVLEIARTLPGNDFEDNVQIACATVLDLDAIVSRNVKDFKAAPMAALTPSELMVQIEKRETF